MDPLELYDLPILGSPFTYFGYGQNVARSRIDRFFVFDGAGAWFSSIIHKVVLRLVSDHLPVTATSGNPSHEYRPFHLFNVWCQDRSLCNLIVTTWGSSTLSHRPLWDKLSTIKHVVSRWQKNQYSFSLDSLKACETN